MDRSPRYGASTTDGWTKASRSNANSGCFELKCWFGGWFLRDSKQGGAGPVIWLADAHWTTLAAWFDAVAADNLRPGTFSIDELVVVVISADGSTTVAGPNAHQPHDQAILRFTSIELDCFLDGWKKNEFAGLKRPEFAEAVAV